MAEFFLQQRLVIRFDVMNANRNNPTGYIAVGEPDQDACRIVGCLLYERDKFLVPGVTLNVAVGL